jgi:hypothetical protein
MVALFSKVTGGVLAFPAFIIESVALPEVPWPGPGLATAFVAVAIPFLHVPFFSSAQTLPSAQQTVPQTRADGQHLPLITSPGPPVRQGAALPGGMMHLPFLHSPPSQQVPPHANFSGQHKGDCVGLDTQVSPAPQHLPPQETGCEVPTRAQQVPTPFAHGPTFAPSFEHPCPGPQQMPLQTPWESGQQTQKPLTQAVLYPSGQQKPFAESTHLLPAAQHHPG